MYSMLQGLGVMLASGIEGVCGCRGFRAKGLVRV